MTKQQGEKNSYLLFRLGASLYGASLLSVKEVFEPQSVSPMPNAHPLFLGATNLRGQIVGVVDLVACLNTAPVSVGNKSVFLLFSCHGFNVAGSIDEVIAVIRIDRGNLQGHGSIETDFNSNYLLGIANTPMGLVKIIDFPQMLSDLVPYTYTKSKLLKTGDLP